MCSLPGIGVFVQGRAVELRESMRVCWEVCGYPIEDDAYAVDVAMVDEIFEIIWRAKTAGWRVIARDLISPGFV